MTRALSAHLLKAMNAQETDEVIVPLLTILHDDLDAPLRFTNVGEAVEHDGETYHHYPFDITMPKDDEESVPRIQLMLDNTTREIMLAVRGLRPEPRIEIKLVTATDLDHVELSYPPMPLRNITGDVFTIEAMISAEDYTGEPFPADKFTPALFPGMF